MRDWLGMIRRGIRKPPRVILNRIATEIGGEVERFRIPARRNMKLAVLLARLEADDLASLWDALAARPYPALATPVEIANYEACCPGDHERIVARAEDALVHRVDMLGSGPVELGEDIDWLTDFRSGVSWPAGYFRDIDFYNAADASDVKIPWELSRLQWLVPLGQAYLLTADMRYARGVRSLVEHWIDHNPYAGTVNWASPMEVSLRLVTMTWLFHVFHATAGWDDAGFREKLLRSLYLHAEFTERHTVGGDVNSGSYTVNAMGLVFGGLFFGRGQDAQRWQSKGWNILLDEIGRQVHPDGVDFEGAIQYHRLGAEFFLLPALYRNRLDMPVDGSYQDKLAAMARFTAAYTKPDGDSPLLGDAGDTRALPFGGQGHNDHRQLIGIIGTAFARPDLIKLFHGPRDEVFWWLGEAAARALPPVPELPTSMAFPDGGYYVMRGGGDHVFIDCAPVGLAGKGGHGHNDCLSFEAVLDGVPLVTDCGTYVYTGSFAERNAFRSTACHNTPQIDGEEINRIPDPNWLWRLDYDAVPEVAKWEADEHYALFIGRHRGYRRLASPVTPQRLILADFVEHFLYLEDHFLGDGPHAVSEPMHLAPGVTAVEAGADSIFLDARGKRFRMRWNADSGYSLDIQEGRVSPSYGVSVATPRLVWSSRGGVPKPFAILIGPVTAEPAIESSLKQRLALYGITPVL